MTTWERPNLICTPRTAWKILRFRLRDGQTAQRRLPRRECEGCLETPRKEKARKYELGREEDLQTVVTIPGWSDADEMAHYPNSDTHADRTPTGRRVPCVLLQEDGTYTLISINHVAVSEHQQKFASAGEILGRVGERSGAK